MQQIVCKQRTTAGLYTQLLTVCINDSRWHSLRGVHSAACYRTLRQFNTANSKQSRAHSLEHNIIH